MSTILQQNLAKEIIKNSKRKKPLNKKELLVSSGYGEISAKASAGFIIDQKGVLEALEDYGFSVDNAQKVVAEILLNPKNDPNARLKASDQVFKVHGKYNDSSINLSFTQNNITIEEKEVINKALDAI